MTDRLALIAHDALEAWAADRSSVIAAAIGRQKVRLGRGEACLVDADDPTWLALSAPGAMFWRGAAVAASLPPGAYHLESDLAEAELGLFQLGWRYGAASLAEAPQLLPPASHEIAAIADAQHLARRLIDAPPNQLTPKALAAEVAAVAAAFGTQATIHDEPSAIVREFPLVAAVGGASSNAPAVAELRWCHPEPRFKLAVVGKGVTFDTGGLHVKAPAGMATMKKDMAGAALALGLAQLIIALRLRIDLHLVIPTVENAIGGRAFRPGDVLASRAGLTVEIDDPDAEGRLILADALAFAGEQKPDVIIDMATLTGAQRMACGFELPGFFTSDDALADRFARAGTEIEDPVWRLPLFRAYANRLESRNADLCNAGTRPQGEAIIAALFLERFVPSTCDWLHIDFMGWNVDARPGRPVGGEPQGLRAIQRLLSGLCDNYAVDVTVSHL